MVDKNKSDREVVFEQDLQIAIERYPHIIGKASTKLPTPYPDVDHALYDSNTKTLLTLEMKWITEPRTPGEIVSKDEDLDKGLNTQLKNYKEGILLDLDGFMRNAFNQPYPVENIEFMVLTRISVGSGFIRKSGEYDVLNVRMLKRALYDKKGNLLEVIKKLKREEYHPKENVHFKKTQTIIKVAGVKSHC